MTANHHRPRGTRTASSLGYDTVAFTAKREDADTFLIMDGNQKVGLAIRLGSDKWGMYDAEANRMGTSRFETAHDVARAFPPAPTAYTNAR